MRRNMKPYLKPLTSEGGDAGVKHPKYMHALFDEVSLGARKAKLRGHCCVKQLEQVCILSRHGTQP